ncbi:hypothetical protein AbraIFM66951_005515 [Aspergillus brasiliensis]|uniref:Hydrophobic surface binding protein A-domain-containing protein n=1 Tax=Aspergillus brasiliensis TaxID=319629 RepID=A0A9W5YYT5_9EURO|nr:hypothetical protein AbraCBS73388_002348 [Aspergillus brasiliensis]GKZ51368.1 hypothetical protein AbraIFM66951_005515 [Aspergillus brasiliensis]
MVLLAKLLIPALTAAATPILRRDAITVERDLNTMILPQVSTLGNDVEAFPESGLTGALAIGSDLQALIPTVDAVTADINNTGSLDEESGTTVLTTAQGVIGDLLRTLADLQNKAPSWPDMLGKQLLISNLESLNTAFDNLANSLIAIETPPLNDQVTTLKNQMDSGFRTAIAAYSA